MAVISHSLWTRRFGRDTRCDRPGLAPGITTGRAGEVLTIVGVMPEGFDFPRGTDIWVPAAPLVRMNAAEWTGGDVEAAMKWLRVFYGVGRLRPGVTAEMAAGELSGVVRATDTQGGPEPPTNAVVTPIQSYLLGPAEPVLWTLLGGAALMLLVACANVAGLQVSRAARRERALAVRLALGARHGHLVRQSIAESVLITTAASGGAVAVCLASVRGLLLLAPADVPRLETVSLLDVRVLAFAAAVAFLSVLVCGLWPALVVGRLDTLSVLAHGPATTGLPRGRLVQRLVVTAQVALALTLLVGTALFVRTVFGLDRTVLGFEPDHLLAVEVAPASEDLDRWNHTYAAIEARVAALPGVTSVGAVYLRPLSGPIGLDNQPFFPGQVPENPTTWGLNPHHNLQTVTPGYFEAMGIKVVRGRGFLATDTSPVARGRGREPANGAALLARPRPDWPAAVRHVVSAAPHGAAAGLADRGGSGRRRALSRSQRRASRHLRARGAIEPAREVPDGAVERRRGRRRRVGSRRRDRGGPPCLGGWRCSRWPTSSHPKARRGASSCACSWRSPRLRRC